MKVIGPHSHVCPLHETRVKCSAVETLCPSPWVSVCGEEHPRELIQAYVEKITKAHNSDCSHTLAKVNFWFDAESQANTRMMAAAPVMYEALKLTIERLERFGEWDDGCFYYNCTSAPELQIVLTQGKSALAQAEGW